MEQLVLEGIPEWRREDSGQALIATLYNEESSGNFINPFVRLQSYSDDGWPVHSELERFRGHRIRVTVEVIE
jgi:hypothetical protein